MRSGLGIGIRLIISLVFALSPVWVYAHPGKTDVRGGHKCWKGCRQWELYHGEYHLHDKDFRPIRLNQSPPVKPLYAPEPIPVQPAVQETLPTQRPVPVVQLLPETVKRTPVSAMPSSPAEESLFSLNPYAIPLLALLLLLLAALFMVRRKRRG